MAFTGQSTTLKLGFIMDALLVLLGLITLFSLYKYSTTEIQGRDVCVLFAEQTGEIQPSSCTFSTAAGGIIVLAAAVLTFMDYVTWKRSENYKGKRASVTVYGNVTPVVKGIYTGISCAALSGLFFAIYGVSEYVQYRRRHINGDKW
ncbi:hypothetical protein BGZ81_008784 [Podila clonocystis]|nr:hypothetical protein BGZ81_008784 [Podila clonocystis]